MNENSININNGHNIKESMDFDEMITPIQKIASKIIIRKNFEIMRGIDIPLPTSSSSIKNDRFKHKFIKSSTNNISNDSSKYVLYKSSFGVSTLSYSDHVQDTTGNDHLLKKSIESGGTNSNNNLLSNNNSNSNNDSISHIDHSKFSRNGQNSKITMFQSHTIIRRINDKSFSNM